MSVFLDDPLANRLVADVIRRCGPDAPLLSTMVINWGGKRLADATTAGVGQMSRVSFAREFCLMAKQGAVKDGTADLVAPPEEWVRRQPEAIRPAPALMGAALRIYAMEVAPHATQGPVPVGVIGLLGVESSTAVTILAEAIMTAGLLTTANV